MNCQDHLYRHADPRQVSRPWFLERCGVGLGSIALDRFGSESRDRTWTAESRVLLNLDETITKE